MLNLCALGRHWIPDPVAYVSLLDLRSRLRSRSRCSPCVCGMHSLPSVRVCCLRICTSASSTTCSCSSSTTRRSAKTVLLGLSRRRFRGLPFAVLSSVSVCFIQYEVLVAGRYMQFFEQPVLKALFASYPGERPSRFLLMVLLCPDADDRVRCGFCGWWLCD